VKRALVAVLVGTALVAACGHEVALDAEQHQAAGDASMPGDASTDTSSATGFHVGDDVDAGPDGAPLDCSNIIDDFSGPIDPSWLVVHTFDTTTSDAGSTPYGRGTGTADGQSAGQLTRTGTAACGVDVSALLRVVATGDALTVTTLEIDVNGIQLSVTVDLSSSTVNLVQSGFAFPRATAQDVRLSTFTKVHVAISPDGPVSFSVGGKAFLGPGAGNYSLSPLRTRPIIKVGAVSATESTGLPSATKYEVDVDDLTTAP
jgi:hypothetical protein